MAKYTIKQGDTLANIAKQYGTTVQKIASTNAIQDPNLIKSGQTLNIPESKSILGTIARTIFSPVLSGGNLTSIGLNNTQTNPVQTNPVITDTEVNIGNIQPDVKPTKEEVTVMSYKDNPDGTTTNYLSDGTTSTVRYNRVDGGALQPYEVAPGETTPVVNNTGTDDLTSRIGSLQKEITDLETSIANKSTNRQSAYQEAGVFDDIRTLNELKTNLRKAQDEAIAIPIEAKQRLSGRGATTTEYAQTTAGDLEENLLKQLTASRQVESLTNIINTNTALINQKVDEQYQADTFLLENKNKRLDNIVKSYGDIMTENQKANLEAVKQQNAIELENIKFKNDLMKSASEEAIKAGVNPTDVFNAVQSGDVSKVYQVSGQTTTDIDKTVDMVNLLESMLDNEKGLAGSAGVKALFGGTALAPNANRFRTDAKELASKATLEYYSKLKANGAVFGTMTESEWKLLSNASDVASLGINPETGKSILSDKVLRERLQDYTNAQMKVATAVAMEKLGINPSILKDKDYLDIRENYYKRYIPKAYEQASQKIDYTQQDTGATNFIQQEEGFKPTAYQDQAGVWTIGYGTTKINGVPVKQGDTVSEEQARKIALEQAVNDYSTFADKLGDVELTPNQFTALNSFEYNLGSGVWDQPTGQQILQAIANKDFQTANTLMQKFVNVKNPQTGKLEPNKSLISRRQREGQLLFS